MSKSLVILHKIYKSLVVHFYYTHFPLSLDIGLKVKNGKTLAFNAKKVV